jgi:hypothetical protein
LVDGGKEKTIRQAINQSDAGIYKEKLTTAVKYKN